MFLAQLAGHGGVGAWPIGVSALITLYIALLAYVKRGDLKVTRTDWAFFVAAVSALPLWFATSDPVWAVLLLTLADLIGFGPTLRKAYHYPHEESLFFFTLGAVRNLLVVLALEHYSMTTVLFPAAIGLACLLLSVMLVLRRRAIAPSFGANSPPVFSFWDPSPRKSCCPGILSIVFATGVILEARRFA